MGKNALGLFEQLDLIVRDKIKLVWYNPKTNELYLTNGRASGVEENGVEFVFVGVL